MVAVCDSLMVMTAELDHVYMLHRGLPSCRDAAWWWQLHHARKQEISTAI